MFEKLLGNGPIKAYLQKAIDTEKVPHALLFAGPAGVGKSLFAKELAASLLRSAVNRIDGESHPDFHPLRPEGKSGLHSIDSLRSLIDEVHNAPFESVGKVFLIYEAERMQTASANAILKTLEEPNPDTTLILLTEYPNEILPTIRSRCQILSFKPIPEEEIKTFLKEKGLPEKLAPLSQGSLAKALERSGKNRIETELFQILSERPSYPALLQRIEKLEAMVEDEDPVIKNGNVDQIFTLFLMWARDQNALAEGVSKEFLFFESESPGSFPTLQKAIKNVETAREHYLRNIKFSVCVESLLDF